jgi:hypothetical protein
MKLLFDHIEKTGGMTVTRYLESCFANDDRLMLYKEGQCNAANESFTQAMPLLVAGHHAHYIAHKCPNHMKVTVLRDPVDRVMSLFRFCKQREYIPVKATVREFLDNPVANNYYTWRFSGIPPFLIRKCPELAVDRALHSLSLFDRIGFTNDIAGFIKSLELPVAFAPNVVNKTIYREEIADRDIELIRNANLLDAKVFEAVAGFANVVKTPPPIH